MQRQANKLAMITVLLMTPAIGVAQDGPVYKVAVSGVIEMGLAPYVERSLREAADAGAPAVVLEIETPGGRVDAAQRIVKAITNADLPVYAFVNTHAWSAGALIALATDSIFMVPGSSIGAATPVTGEGKKGSEKIVSAMRGEFRALAERRGIDPRLAEAMVDEEIAVEGVIEAGKLLTLTASEAVDLGFADGIVEDLDGVLIAVGVGQREVVAQRVNWAEQLVRFLSHPVVAPLLLSLGMLGLFVELKTPTFGVAGLIGLTSFAAFFGSHLLVGLAGWEEVILLGAGLIALGIEVFVIPGFGIAGVISILCIGSAIFLSLLGNIPTFSDFARASSILAGAMMIVAVGVVALFKLIPTAGKARGVFLKAAMDSHTGYISAEARGDLEGAEGRAATDLHPSGIGTFDGERLDIVTQGEFVPKGSRIRVVQSDGYRHVVEAVEAERTA